MTLMGLLEAVTGDFNGLSIVTSDCLCGTTQTVISEQAEILSSLA